MASYYLIIKAGAIKAGSRYRFFTAKFSTDMLNLFRIRVRRKVTKSFCTFLFVLCLCVVKFFVVPYLSLRRVQNTASAKKIERENAEKQ
jgi:hypothetical protein